MLAHRFVLHQALFLHRLPNRLRHKHRQLRARLHHLLGRLFPQQVHQLLHLVSRPGLHRRNHRVEVATILLHLGHHVRVITRSCDATVVPIARAHHLCQVHQDLACRALLGQARHCALVKDHRALVGQVAQVVREALAVRQVHQVQVAVHPALQVQVADQVIAAAAEVGQVLVAR